MKEEQGNQVAVKRKKKSALWAVLGGCVLLAVLAVVLLLCFGNFKPQNGILQINGMVISDAAVEIHEDSARTSFVSVLEGMGYTINWMDDDTAMVICGTEIYFLDVAEPVFQKEGTDVNLILPPPGTTTFYCESVERDVILDDNTICGIFSLMGQRVFVEIDRETAVVSFYRP